MYASLVTYNVAKSGIRVVSLDLRTVRLAVEEESGHSTLWAIRVLLLFALGGRFVTRGHDGNELRSVLEWDAKRSQQGLFLHNHGKEGCERERQRTTTKAWKTFVDDAAL